MLGNKNPIIKDGQLIFRNDNRLFFFIRTTSNNGLVDSENRIPTELFETNLQISLYTYLIGLFIYQLQMNSTQYDEKCQIHENQSINKFIHKTLNNPPNLKLNFTTSLVLVYSNGDAILDPVYYSFGISSVNYLILLILNRIEGNPGLFFFNNSYATKDVINLILAQLDIRFPCK